MKDNNPLIKVDHLVKQFGDTKALNDVSAEIRHGEVVVVVGPSGSGKSTFLRCLNLLEEPTEGQIFFEGTDITDPRTNINTHRQKTLRDAGSPADRRHEGRCTTHHACRHPERRSRPCGGHPRHPQRGRRICPAGSCRDRRAAPLWGASARDAGRKSREPASAGDERHSHPPHAGTCVMVPPPRTTSP